MLVADDEVQRTGALLAGRLAGLGLVWALRRSLVRWPFIFFIVDVQRANDKELPGRVCNFVQDFSRGTGRSFERDLDHVALDQFRLGCRRFRGAATLCRDMVSGLAMFRVLPATGDVEVT